MREQATILIVDDDPVINDSVRDILCLAGYRTLTATNGAHALEILDVQTPDLIVADIMMPRMNGYQLYQRVRRNPDWIWIPFIFLTAKGEGEDVRYAKEMGVDDYLTKPIEPEDLLAAVLGKLARYRELGAGDRHPPTNRATGCYEVANLHVDLSRREVSADGRSIALSPTEFDILQRLILADGAVVFYDDLLAYDDAVLDFQDAAGLLRYHIRNLRRKLEEGGVAPDVIVNVRGKGYRLVGKPARISERF